MLAILAERDKLQVERLAIERDLESEQRPVDREVVAVDPGLERELEVDALAGAPDLELVLFLEVDRVEAGDSLPAELAGERARGRAVGAEARMEPGVVLPEVGAEHRARRERRGSLQIASFEGERGTRARGEHGDEPELGGDDEKTMGDVVHGESLPERGGKGVHATAGRAGKQPAARGARGRRMCRLPVRRAMGV